MTISSSLVGQTLKGMTRRISWRQTTNYAAAVADINEAYFDDTKPGGIIAPPLFAVAVTWPLMANVAEQLPALPPEVLPTIVHYSEHLIFHRPIRPDDKLTLSGEVAAVLPRKGGTHLVLRTEAKDSRGEDVFTEYGGVMLRGVTCEDKGAGARNLPYIPEWEPDIEPLWDAEIPIAPEAPYVYDGCTEIVFPIHTSPTFAKMVGLPGIILQGTATLAMAARELVDREAANDPNRLREIACTFTGMVKPGTAIRLKLLHKSGGQLHFAVINDKGKAVLSNGFASIE